MILKVIFPWTKMKESTWTGILSALLNQVKCFPHHGNRYDYYPLKNIDFFLYFR